MENLAPVLITTLNRSVHFKRCVESLALCTHADKTILYIALDYPLHDGHWAGYEEIKEFLPKIRGFKSVIIIERDRNLGAVDNFFKALDEVFEKYDRVIISEDDNVFSIDFLAFVNKGLEVYEKRSDIFSISGYQYPIKVPKAYKDDVYIWTGFSAWGVGIWKEKWRKVDWEYKGLGSFLNDKNNIRAMNKIAENYIPALRRIIETKRITGDTLICYHEFIHKMYSVFPTISRVRNTGNDGTGINCVKLNKDIYSNQVIYNEGKNYNIDITIKPDKKIYYILNRHFRIKNISKIKQLIKCYLIALHLYK